MASLLAVATVFVGLWTLNIYILQSEKGGLIREGGALAGFYGIRNIRICVWGVESSLLTCGDTRAEQKIFSWQ
jgi:hypothetical protein